MEALNVLMARKMRDAFGIDEMDSFRECVGKKIKSLVLNEDDSKLHFEFEDGIKLRLFDYNCSCGRRYTRTDDHLPDYVGAVLTGAEIRTGPTTRDEEFNEPHEVQFLVVFTRAGQFTMSNHNEHNGCYSGFDIVSRFE